MQEENAFGRKYFRARCFDPLTPPRIPVNDFRREEANPLRDCLSRIHKQLLRLNPRRTSGVTGLVECSGTEAGSSSCAAAFQKFVAQILLRSPDQKGSTQNFGICLCSAFVSIAVRVRFRRRPCDAASHAER